MNYAIFALGLISSAAYAQSTTTDYVLQLNPGIGDVLTSTLNMGAPQTTTVNGCDYTTVTDGAVICFTGDSCNPSGLPDCGILFSGPSGLTLPDVATLITSSSSGSGGPTGAPTPIPSATPSPMPSPSGAPGVVPTGTPYSPYGSNSSIDVGAAAKALKR